MISNLLPHLPEEILLEIFSRLPTKSAARCRCLSTTWRAHLSNSKFALLHFTHHPKEETTTGQSGLVFVTEDVQRRFKVYTIPEHDAVSKQIQLPTAPRYQITGSCNGLVLLVAFPDESLLLFNPLSLDVVAIPDSGWDLDNNWIGKQSYHGLGYDCVTDDFKIAKFSRLSYDHRVVDVYSLKTGVWKRIVSPSHYTPIVEEFYAGVFMNGAIHWYCRTTPDNGYMIVVFYLTDEVFSREIRVPCEFFMTFVHCGCLCLIDVYDNTRDVWMMRQYGLAESWTKIGSLYGSRLPLFDTGDNKILFEGADGTMPFVEYSLEEGVWETMVVNGHVSGRICNGATFIHSLFSPNHGSI